MVNVRLNNSYALKLYMFNPGDEWYLHYDHFPVPREKAVSIDAGTRYVIVDLKTKRRKDVYGAEVGNCTDLEDYSETSKGTFTDYVCTKGGTNKHDFVQTFSA